MSTYLFLKRFLLDNRQILELSQIYHHIYFKGLQDRYLASNDPMLSFVGLENHGQLMESKSSDLIKDPLVLTNVLDHDQIVIDSQCTKVFYEASKKKNQHVQFLSIKAPLYSENTLMGLCGISFTLDNYNYSDFNTILTKISNLLQEDCSIDIKESLFKQGSQPKLTARELECLHFYMRGHSIKYIAETLLLSNRTIEFYVDNIKTKFGVSKRSELVPLAFNLYPELA